MPQPCTTHHKSAGLGNRMTILWLRGHTLLMGHSCCHSGFDWLGNRYCVQHESLVARWKLQFKTRLFVP